MPDIIITRAPYSPTVPVGVGGKVERLPVGSEITVSDEVLAVLDKAPHIVVCRVDSASARSAGAGVAPGGSAPAPNPAEPASEIDLIVLDQSVPKIVALLDGMTRADLIALRAAEDAGKTRSTLMAAIDARLTPEGDN